MSRAGALASGAIARLVETMQPGLKVAATQAYADQEARKIELATKGLERVLTRLIGPINADDIYILDEYTDQFRESTRVCIDIDGITFNYTAATSKDPEHVVIVAGTCATCRNFPCLLFADSLEDVGYMFSPPGQRFVKTYVCSQCKKK